MKKIFLFILLILFSILSYSQAIPDDRIPKTNITLNQIVNGWAMIGTTCAGCASFYYKILRNDSKVLAEDGNYYYYYYIYYYNNSYYANGTLASTYISNIKFYINNNLVLTLNYVLIPTNQSLYVCWLRVPTYDAKILFFAEKITVY